MLEKGHLTPILVRSVRGKFVLVEGLRRLEVFMVLGEETVVGLLFQSRLHQVRTAAIACSNNLPETGTNK